MNPEDLPTLSAAELAEFREMYPDLPEMAEKLARASGTRTMEAPAPAPDGVMLNPSTGQPMQSPEFYAGSQAEKEVERPDWNTGDSRARQRLENYYSAVMDGMQQPVISVRAAADIAAGRVAEDEQAIDALSQEFQSRMAEAYPNGYMTPSDFLKEISLQPFLIQVDMQREQDANFPDEIVAAMADQITAEAAQQAQLVADRIGQKDFSPEAEEAAMMVREVVQAHGPKGMYAPYASRTAEENERVASAPFVEDPAYRLTKDGAQNHRAMRVAELFSASDEGYAPATGFSQLTRAVGGTMGPLINRVRGVSDSIDRRNAEGTAFDDMREIGSTYGKFGYAANLYNAAGQGDPQDVYAPDGTAKYYGYDPTNQTGLAQATYNTAFPVGRMYNNTAPVREVALHMGEWLAGRDPASTAQNIRQLRRSHNAITPTVADGIDPEQQRAAGEQLEDADARMEGMMSATLGPKFADVTNAVLGTNVPREYLSPAMDTLLQVPAESMSDPINLGFNLLAPGTAGMIAGGTRGAAVGGLTNVVKGAGKGLLAGLKTAPVRMGDDVVEEMVENNVIAPATMGIGAFFSPEQDNLLMQGYEGDPNTPGFDQEVERRHLEARENQINAADAYGRMRDEGAKKKADERYRALGPQTRPVASVRFGDEQPTEAGKTLQGMLSGPQSREEAEYEEWRKSQGYQPSRTRSRPVAEVRW